MGGGYKYTKEPYDWRKLCNLVHDLLSDSNKVELTTNIVYSWVLNEIDEIQVKILLKKLYSIGERNDYLL
jgi:hypothetical protein